MYTSFKHRLLWLLFISFGLVCHVNGYCYSSSPLCLTYIDNFDPRFVNVKGNTMTITTFDVTSDSSGAITITGYFALSSPLSSEIDGSNTYLISLMGTYSFFQSPLPSSPVVVFDSFSTISGGSSTNSPTTQIDLCRSPQDCDSTFVDYGTSASPAKSTTNPPYYGIVLSTSNNGYISVYSYNGIRVRFIVNCPNANLSNCQVFPGTNNVVLTAYTPGYPTVLNQMIVITTTSTPTTLRGTNLQSIQQGQTNQTGLGMKYTMYSSSNFLYSFQCNPIGSTCTAQSNSQSWSFSQDDINHGYVKLVPKSGYTPSADTSSFTTFQVINGAQYYTTSYFYVFYLPSSNSTSSSSSNGKYNNDYLIQQANMSQVEFDSFIIFPCIIGGSLVALIIISKFYREAKSKVVRAVSGWRKNYKERMEKRVQFERHEDSAQMPSSTFITG